MRLLLAAWAALVLLVGSEARAHDGLPVVVMAEEKGQELYLLRLILPPSVPEHVRPVLALHGSCEAVHADDPVSAEHGADTGRRVTGRVFRCPGGMGGNRLELLYPGGKPAVSTLVRISWLSGENRSVLAGPGEEEVDLPAPESASGVFRDYLKLGIEHILFGWDHLLFLLCLLILAGRPKRVLLMVTGFTLGHALTISAATLDLAGLPGPPVEAAIAFSIMILAAEILRQDRDTLTWRYPVLISALFGLLHGFGFASALRDIGLPQLELPWALLAFNLGIEAGQLCFIGACAIAYLGIGRIARRVAPGRVPEGSEWLGVPIAWVAGSLAAYWFVSRIPGVFGA